LNKQNIKEVMKNHQQLKEMEHRVEQTSISPKDGRCLFHICIEFVSII
jgi:hypothetical protein